MNTYKVTGVENARFAEDGSSADVILRTGKGNIKLTLKSEHLDQFATKLDGLVFEASLQAPAGAQGKVRIDMVDGYKIGRGMVDGVVHVTLAFGLGQGGVVRWYALTGKVADALQRSLLAEIPRLPGAEPAPATEDAPATPADSPKARNKPKKGSA